MHKFLRALGFGQINNREAEDKLIKYAVETAEIRSYVTNEEGEMLAEYRKEIIKDTCGIAVVGIFNDDDRFVIDYYYPYLIGREISSGADIYVQKRADKDSYLGSCDEVRVGVSLVFDLLNIIPYIKHEHEDEKPLANRTVTLSALSIDGKILMPIAKNERQIVDARRKARERYRNIASARNGDEGAMESLTLGDMDYYTTISNHIRSEDIYTMVDTTFMPYGMECDQYTVLGEIVRARQFLNKFTQETFWVMGVLCNNMIFEVMINTEDLYGTPEVGRRFKGSILMQGIINFDD